MGTLLMNGLVMKRVAASVYDVLYIVFTQVGRLVPDENKKNEESKTRLTRRYSEHSRT
jgi:hypothetical protein